MLASNPTLLVMERGLLEYTFPASPEVSPVLAVPIAYWGNSFGTLSIWGSVAELVLSSAWIYLDCVPTIFLISKRWMLPVPLA